jgi:hypothetical protein
MNKEDKSLRNTITFLALLFMFSAMVVSGSLENIDFERVLEALPVLG